MSTPTAIAELVGDEKKVNIYHLAIYGFMGAFMACLIDTIQNDTAAVPLKIKTALQAMLGLPVHAAINILFICALGALACALQKSKSQLDAFARGLAVFTFFNLATPNGPAPTQDVHDKGARIEHNVPASFHFASVQKEILRPNAEVMVANEWMSKTKPEYSGVLGINTFIDNSINIEGMSDRLSVGQKVEIVSYWDTGLRGYRYALVKFLDAKGVVKQGWIPAGKKPDFWTSVKPMRGVERSIRKWSKPAA